MWHRTDAGGGRLGWPEGLQLVRECEAFLTGQLARELEELHRPIPAWAWLNMLAHGSAEQLRWMARGGLGGAFVAAEPWERGLGFLARELLALADDRRCAVADLQREVLVPLEIEMTHDLGLVETGPGLFVMRVVAALGSARGEGPR